MYRFSERIPADAEFRGGTEGDVPEVGNFRVSTVLDLTPDLSADAVLLRAKLLLLVNQPEKAQRDIGWVFHFMPNHGEAAKLVLEISNRSDRLYGSAMAHVRIPMSIHVGSRAAVAGPGGGLGCISLQIISLGRWPGMCGGGGGLGG